MMMYVLVFVEELGERRQLARGHLTQRKTDSFGKRLSSSYPPLHRARQACSARPLPFEYILGRD